MNFHPPKSNSALLSRQTALVVAAAMSLFTGIANGAEDDVHILRDPDRYLVARGPALSPEQQRQALEARAAAQAAAKSSTAAAGIEKSAAVIPGNFTVIPNVTPSSGGNISYLRFPNFNADISTTATVRMVGDATGRDYGTATVTSDPFSSPQLTVNQLLDSIDGGSFDASDTSLTLYIQSNQFLTGIQHVYYAPSTGFFENMSVCSFVDGVSYAPTMAGVVNVHTTTLQSLYPSVVKIHNKESTATTLTLRVHDGPSGALRGKFSFNAQPNSTYSFTSSAIQAAVSWIPTSDDYHMNVIFDTDAATPPNALISHTVTNVNYAGAALNLTTICNIND